MWGAASAACAVAVQPHAHRPIMSVHLTLDGRQGLASQIYRQLRAGILDGRLAAGERLPSTRELAVQLGVSRKTTLDVFERLTAEGYLRSRTGEGTFVAAAITRR